VVTAVLDKSVPTRRVDARIGKPARALRWTYSKRGETTLPLAHLLNERGIGVFTPKSILAFKVRLVEERAKTIIYNQRRKIWHKKLKFAADRIHSCEMINDHLLPVMIALNSGIIILGLASWLCLVMIEELLKLGINSNWSLAITWVGLTGFLATFPFWGVTKFIFSYLLDEWDYLDQPRRLNACAWFTSTKSRWMERVPSKCHANMALIHTLLPEATFKVHHDAWDTTGKAEAATDSLFPNSFLVVCYRNEQFYIAHWNDRGTCTRLI